MCVRVCVSLRAFVCVTWQGSMIKEEREKKHTRGMHKDEQSGTRMSVEGRERKRACVCV